MSYKFNFNKNTIIRYNCSHPAKGVEIYSQKLKAAGLDKVMKAVQEQADKFIKSKK
ncbi:DUF3502 domain-containing protein [Clostridium estertheticum]|uniref:DUF3502 domain-containing protein n=1 Tax=Clostridium estertheticum TaxID=238834 RepID=UPI00359F6049